MAVKPNGPRTFVVGLATAVFVVAGSLGSAPGAPAALPACDGKWHVVPSADYAANVDDELHAVVALSPTNVWAAGFERNSSGDGHALIEHFNGQVWKIVTTPDIGSLESVWGLTATAPNDVWAVGSYFDDNGVFTPFALHWAGQGWKRFPTPGTKVGLMAVSANVDDDVWAVGGTNNTSTLIVHWNGSKWTRQTSPAPGTTENTLRGASAHLADDAWAVGWLANSGELRDRTLAEHWDGSKWTVEHTADVGGADSLWAVSANTSRDVWAVGRYQKSSDNIDRTLAEHWNGNGWKVVSTPNVTATEEHELRGVTAIASDDAWAVGYRFERGTTSWKTLMLHWNGTAWKLFFSPNPSSIADEFAAVSADSAKDAWAVGDQNNGQGNSRTLVERFCTK